MFGKILVANRGEIALRIIRACRELDIRTVAIYSEVDRNALHVRFADEAVCVGPAPARLSYLHIPNIVTAADITGADAVHPGYGFLAENVAFAEAIRQSRMEFIGPSNDCLNTFGDKLSAKAAARAANVPLLPGSDGAVRDEDEAVAIAEQIGYPLILKAAFGGGGKGMRVVLDAAELRRAFAITCAEAAAAFGKGAVFLERFLVAPRHVEVQVAGDVFGEVVHVGERDCTFQRRHQKLIEEAPAPGLSDRVRDGVRDAAVRLARHTNYHTVGTCEFLVEGGEFFFMEVNPRIQVEHPVTEEVTGIDLVQTQIRLAAGEPMPFHQEDVVIRGHAIEIRVNAEDPWTFMPSPGRITGYHVPGGPGVRIDAAMHEHAEVQPYYDSLIGKLIVHAPTREAAIRRVGWAIDQIVVEGVRTTLPLQRELIDDPSFRNLTHHTRTIDAWLKARRGGSA